MAREPESEETRARRRWFFWGWTAITIAAAIYIGLAAPFVEDSQERVPIVGVIFPPLMILLLGIGIGWLAMYVSRRGPPRKG